MKFESRYILVVKFSDHENAGSFHVASVDTWKSKWPTLARGLAAEALMGKIQVLQKAPSSVGSIVEYWTEVRKDQGNWSRKELPEELEG